MTSSRMRVSDLRPGAPFPKFVLRRNTPCDELRKQRALANYDSSAAFRFEVPNRVCCNWCRNFKSAALGGRSDPRAGGRERLVDRLVDAVEHDRGADGDQCERDTGGKKGLHGHPPVLVDWAT